MLLHTLPKSVEKRPRRPGGIETTEMRHREFWSSNGAYVIKYRPVISHRDDCHFAGRDLLASPFERAPKRICCDYNMVGTPEDPSLKTARHTRMERRRKQASGQRRMLRP